MVCCALGLCNHVPNGLLELLPCRVLIPSFLLLLCPNDGSRSVLESFTSCAGLAVNSAQAMLVDKMLAEATKTTNLIYIEKSSQNGELVLILPGFKEGQKHRPPLHDQFVQIPQSRSFTSFSYEDRSSSDTNCGYIEPKIGQAEVHFTNLKAQLNLASASCNANLAMKKKWRRNSPHKPALLFEMFKSLQLPHSLRTAALRLHSMLSTTCDDVPNKSHHERVHFWGNLAKNHEEQRRQTSVKGNDPRNDFHKWLQHEDYGRRELRAFTDEMVRLVGDSESAWNGVHSAGRVLFHQHHAEFILEILKLLKIIVDTGYYKSLRAISEVLDVISTCILAKAVQLVPNTRTFNLSSQERLRDELISEVTCAALEVVSALESYSRRNLTTRKVLDDFKLIYQHKWENSPTQVNWRCTALQAVANCDVLTDPVQNKATITSKHQRKRENDVVQVYLSEIFSAHVDVNKSSKPGHHGNLYAGSSCPASASPPDRLLLQLGDQAPPEVARRAVNILLRRSDQQRDFFHFASGLLIVVTDSNPNVSPVQANSSKRLREVQDQLFRWTGQSLIDATAAKEIKMLVDDVAAIISRADDSRQIQELCYMQGLVYTLLLVLHQNLSPKQLAGTEEQNTPEQDMLISVFGTLRLCSEGYTKVQNLMFHEVFPVLLMDEIASGPLIAAHLAQSLIPTLRNLKHQSMVRVEDIIKITEKMFDFYSDGFFCAEFLDLLAAVCNLPRNSENTSATASIIELQTKTIELLMAHPDVGEKMLEEKKLIWSAVFSSTANAVRAEEAMKGSLKSMRLQKQFVISLVSLLSKLGEGRNQYIESICKTMIPVGTLLEVLGKIVLTNSNSSDPGYDALALVDFDGFGPSDSEVRPSPSNDGADYGFADSDELDIDQLINNGAASAARLPRTQAAPTGRLLEIHVAMPRFKAYLRFFYHMYLSRECVLEMDHTKKLVLEPDMWAILDHCNVEIVEFSKTTKKEHDETHESDLYMSRQELVFDVCFPFVSNVLELYLTSGKIQENLSERSINPGEMTQRDATVRLKRVNRSLCEALAMITSRCRDQPWWGPMSKESVSRLLSVLLAQHREGSAELKQLVGFQFDAEEKLRAARAQRAPHHSQILKENPKVRDELILDENKQLKEGDDGNVGWQQHVNAEFHKFCSRMSDLDATQNREHHCCWRPHSDGSTAADGSPNQRYSECRFMAELSDDGLPSNSEFVKLVRVLQKYRREDGGGPMDHVGLALAKPPVGDEIIIKHLHHLQADLTTPRISINAMRDSLARKTGIFKLQQFSVDLLASLLHFKTCHAKGNVAHLKSSGDSFKDALDDVQGYQLRLANIGAVKETLHLVNSEHSRVMQSAVSLFSAILEGSAEDIQHHVYDVLNRDEQSRAALFTIREELDSAVASIIRGFAAYTVDAEMAPDVQHKARMQATQAIGQLSMWKHVSNEKMVEEEKQSIIDAGDEKLVSAWIEHDYQWALSLCRAVTAMVEGGSDDIKTLLRENTGMVQIDDDDATLLHLLPEEQESQMGHANFITSICSCLASLPQELAWERLDPEGHPAEAERETARRLGLQRKWLVLNEALFQALSELCQGNFENQLAAVNAKGDASFFKHFNRFLGWPHHKHPVDHANTQRAALATLEMMLESNDDDAKMLARTLIEEDQIDLKHIHRLATRCYLTDLYATSMAPGKGRGIPKSHLYLANGFKCYFILRRFEDLLGESLFKKKVGWTSNDVETVGSSDDPSHLSTKVSFHRRFLKAIKTIVINDEKDIEDEEKNRLIVARYAKRDNRIRKKFSTGGSGGTGNSTGGLFGFERETTATSGGGVSKRTNNAMSFDKFTKKMDSEKFIKDHQLVDRLGFFKSMSIHIEFVRNGTLHVIYFRRPKDLMFSTRIRDQVKLNLLHGTPQATLQQFLRMFEDIDQQLSRQHDLNGHWFLKHFSEVATPYHHALTLTLTYTLNFMMLFAYTAPEEDSGQNVVEAPWFDVPASTVGAIHLLSCIFVSIGHFVNTPWAPFSTAYYIVLPAMSAAGLLFSGFFYGFHLLHVVTNNEILRRTMKSVFVYFELGSYHTCFGRCTPCCSNVVRCTTLAPLS